jgi:hypothetical protein
MPIIEANTRTVAGNSANRRRLADYTVVYGVSCADYSTLSGLNRTIRRRGVSAAQLRKPTANHLLAAGRPPKKL